MAEGPSVITEVATIMFTDIVGSTELSQRLSSDAADEVRRNHFSILRQAIAEAGGTEVKNLGDGLMAVFASSSTALSCAVAMQQKVDRDNRDHEHSVGLRVGLSGGEVVSEDSDYWGDPVIEAARLCALCSGGQILAADIVRAVAGRRSPHACQSVGPLTLKGLPDPVQTVEVLWEPLPYVDPNALVPLPTALALQPSVVMIGRDVELIQIADATKRVASGDGREVLLVSGEAGLGKTTLVAKAARSANATGACVLFGHCEEDLATPYQLFAEALGHYVTHAAEERLLAYVEVHGSELVRLVPALAQRISDLPASKATDSDTERYLLFAAVVGLLRMASEYQPIILVLDDLQWADRASLLLLRHLAAAEPTMQVLAIGTYRDTELTISHPLLETLAALHRLPDVSRVNLAGFNDSDVVALLEATTGYTLDDAGVGLAHAVCRETDGNPFFVTEILRHLAEIGMLYQDATDQWTTADSLEHIALPESVRIVIGARVGRLGEGAQRVLSVASVIGRDFDIELLGKATNASEDELLDILDAASAVALLRERTDTSGRYNFAHALIQHTLYEDLGPTRRARTHRVVAEALEELCGDQPGTRVGELARHWTFAAQLVDLFKAIDYSRQAGESALVALAPADALAYFAQALELYSRVDHPDPVLGIDLAIGLGTAQRQAGAADFRETLLDASRRAADLNDTERLVAAALANNRGTYSAAGSIDAERVQILEMVQERLAPDDHNRALILATLCSEVSYGAPLERRKALADEAVAIARSSGDDAVIVRVLNLISLSLMVPSMLEQSLAWTSDAMLRAERVGDPVMFFTAAGTHGIAAAHTGDTDEFDRCLEIMTPLDNQINQSLLSWRLNMRRSVRAMIAGDHEQAEQFANDAFQFGTDSGQPDALILFGANLVTVNLQRGTLHDMVPMFEQFVADNPGLPVFAAVLAAAHADGDRLDNARRVLAEFAATDYSLPLDQGWLTGMIGFSLAAIECRDPDYAAQLFDRLAPWAEHWALLTAGTVEGPVSQYLGALATVLGRFDEANAYFVQAAESCVKTSAKYFAAQTDLWWGTMLAERNAVGDIERAKDLLSRAHAAAVANNYGTVERRSSAALLTLP
ncbi:MAG TPA: AAA family ATPase [Acidimicrobiales bacterium]|nr:AAA family ATPase [Acidimicrobiales bacterium]